MPAAPPPAGFAEFVAGRAGALKRSAWLLTMDDGRAEDLVQVALADVWRRWARLADGNPEAYARKVMYTTYASWWRRKWRGERPSPAVPDRPADADHAAAHADRDAVARALAGLSRQQRAVVVARYVEDLSVADTAELLGCSVQTVKVQSSRGLAKLRQDPHLRTFRTGEHTAGATT